MMQSSLSISQLLLHRDGLAPKIVAMSRSIEFAVEEELLRMAVKFGERPAGLTFGEALFAKPVNAKWVAVVRVQDRPDGTLAFHTLLVPTELYTFVGDPFFLADQFPPTYDARGSLPELVGNSDWQPPRRDVKELLERLKAGDSALLLGTTQALLDGAHVAITRPTADPDLVRTVWLFLPDRVRNELWPATFAFSSELNFDLAIVPKEQPGFLSEEQAKDYPEGRYELNLQVAIENGNQTELDRLLARKSSKEVLRLAAIMLIIVFVATAILRFL
jgi:hypothetical protein